MIGPFKKNSIVQGDCRELIELLPDESLDIIITSPPYWGQRLSTGVGVEDDPREYIQALAEIFNSLKSKLKQYGNLWINIGDAYNTPVNWTPDDFKYSSLGPEGNGLNENNSAYKKPRQKRKAFTDSSENWLVYGNLLALPYRLVIALCDKGYLFRGEIIWRKNNPMPEGRCRRPHRQHESIFLIVKNEKHQFRINPPVKSVWEFPNEKIKGLKHYSRFPTELPKRCIQAFGIANEDVIVFDPFSGSGTTCLMASQLGCSYLGFEIDPKQVVASNDRLKEMTNLELFAIG